MSINEFIEAFNENKSAYTSHKALQDLSRELMDADIKSTLMECHITARSTLLVQLDDGKVQIDGHYACGTVLHPIAMYVVEISHIYR